ncbi:MAG: hypothetical protein Q7T70_03200 [Polaromonas sp.]|nr:hypothetical protein [Polaromonas sp.]
MSEPEQPAESAVPLFDVSVSVPASARLSDIERQALETGISAERVGRLMQVLKSSPQAKIGSGVPREKADQAEAQFSKAGLIVTITPLLAIQAAMAGSYDGTFVCPACQKRVILPENRQCPACGIFVDKVTDEFLLRRKLMEQERGKIEFAQAKSAKESDKRAREIMEASLRAQVRAEIEKEFGIKGSKRGLFSRSAGAFKLLGVVGLLAVAFMGGRGFSTEGLPFGKAPAAKTSGAPGTMTPDSLGKTAQATAADGTAGGADAAGEAASDTGDVDLDDPLLQQAAGGKRPGGKGLTIEQAVAASQTLAKSVGNTTAERALAGGPSGGKGGAGAASGANASTGGSEDIDAKIESASGGTAPAGSASGKAAAGAIPGGATGAASTAVVSTMPKQTKLILSAEFVRTLAELGQSARARGVLKAAMASLDPAAEPEAAAALRSADVRAQAWAIQRREAGAPGKAADELKAKIQAVADPAERTQLLGQTAVILSRGGQLAPELPRAFLTLASESLKSVAGASQQQALGDLAVSMGEVFAHETTARARSGMWTKAQASAGQIDALVKQAPDPWAQLRLQALDHQVKLQLGQNDKAKQSLDLALAQAGKNTNLAERAAWLRSIAQLGDAAAQEQMDAVTANLQAQLENKSGMEKAQALTQLSLLYANGGLPSRAEQYRRMAQSIAGLSRAESTTINMDLLVRGDLAMARVLQGLGRYAEAEAMLQRVGGYLL